MKTAPAGKQEADNTSCNGQLEEVLLEEGRATPLECNAILLEKGNVCLLEERNAILWQRRCTSFQCQNQMTAA